MKFSINTTYIACGVSAWGLEFNKEPLKSKELTPYKKCGLYKTVDFYQVSGSANFEPILVLKVTLTKKGEKYFNKTYSHTNEWVKL